MDCMRRERKQKEKKKKSLGAAVTFWESDFSSSSSSFAALEPRAQLQGPAPFFLEGRGGGAGGRKSGKVFLSSIPRMPLCPPFDRLEFFFFFSFYFTTDVSSQASASPLQPSLPPSFLPIKVQVVTTVWHSLCACGFCGPGRPPSSWGTLLVTLGPLPARRWETGEGQEMSAASPPRPPSLPRQRVCVSQSPFKTTGHMGAEWLTPTLKASWQTAPE